MGFDGRYRNKICINCFMLNNLCSMWSNADWFPHFKQDFNTEATWKEHCICLWVVPLSSSWWCLRAGGHLPTYLSCAPGLTEEPGHRWEICTRKKSCRHSPMAEIGITCTASLEFPIVCLHSHHRAQIQELSELAVPARTFFCVPPLWQVSAPLRAGRPTAKVQQSVWYTLLLGKITFWKIQNFQNWKWVLSFHFFWYFLEYFYQGIT